MIVFGEIKALTEKIFCVNINLLILKGVEGLNRFKNLLKQRYFKELFSSYGIMLCALFVIYIITFVVTNNIIVVERENILSYMSLNTRTKLDNEILRVEQMAIQIAAQKEVKELIEDPPQNEFIYNDYEIFQYLQSLMALDANLDNIYLYRKGTDKIISANSVTSLEDFYASVHKSADYTKETWMSFLEKNHAKTLTVLPSSNEGKNFIAYVNSFPFSPVNSAKVQLVVLLDTDEITNMALKTEELQCEQFVIANKKGEVVFSYGDLVPQEKLSEYLLKSDKKVIKDKIGGRKIVAESRKSDVISWQYVTIVSRDIYNRQIKNLGLAIFLCALIYFAIGVSLIYFFSKRNYEPLERLITNFKKFETESGDKILNGEFDAITEKINAVYNDNKELQKLNEKNIDKLQSDYLKSILDNIINRENFARNHSPENYGIEISSNIFSVILIKIENINEFGEVSEMGLAPDLMRYSIANVVCELIGMQKCKGYSITLQNDSMAAVVNFPNDASKEEGRRTLFQIMSDLRGFFEEHYHSYLSLSSTADLRPIEDLNICYAEASEAMEYRLIRGKNHIIFYDEVKDKLDDYIYGTDTEEQLISNLKAGNFDAVKKIIDRLFAENVYGEKITVDAMRSFVFDLARTLLKNIPHGYGYSISLDKIMTDTASENHEKFLAAAKSYCTAICENSEKPLSEKIMEYVEANYVKQELGVNMLGEVFDLAPSYLSRLFKEQTGKALPTYIHKVRIARSKELLIKDLTMEEIANRVGYFSADSFGRIFKRLEGITPGKYRKQTLGSAYIEE